VAVSTIGLGRAFFRYDFLGFVVLAYPPVQVPFTLRSFTLKCTSSLLSRHSLHAVLTAAYEGRSLTADIEFEVVTALGCDVVVGPDWLAAWRQVGREDLPVPMLFSSSRDTHELLSRQ